MKTNEETISLYDEHKTCRPVIISIDVLGGHIYPHIKSLLTDTVCPNKAPSISLDTTL